MERLWLRDAMATRSSSGTWRVEVNCSVGWPHRHHSARAFQLGPDQGDCELISHGKVLAVTHFWASLHSIRGASASAPSALVSDSKFSHRSRRKSGQSLGSQDWRRFSHYGWRACACVFWLAIGASTTSRIEELATRYCEGSCRR